MIVVDGLGCVITPNEAHDLESWLLYSEQGVSLPDVVIVSSTSEFIRTLLTFWFLYKIHTSSFSLKTVGLKEMLSKNQTYTCPTYREIG